MRKTNEEAIFKGEKKKGDGHDIDFVKQEEGIHAYTKRGRKLLYSQ